MYLTPFLINKYIAKKQHVLDECSKTLIEDC
jgi:hypothetical protein